MVSHRYAVLTLGAIWFYFRGRDFPNGDPADWGIFVHFSRDFSSAAIPWLGVYMGPLALACARPFASLSLTTGWSIYSALCMVLGLVSLRWMESAAISANLGEPRARQRVVLVGGMFVLYAWSLPAVTAGHPDDVLALALISLGVRAVARGQWLVAAVAVGAAVEAKPWAWLVLPLAVACAGRRVRGLLIAVAVATLPWLPYVLIVQGSIHAHKVDLFVGPLSGAHLLGAAVDSTPSWPRLVQLAIAIPIGYYAVLRGRWYLVVALALTVRVSLDPATLFYYQAGPVVGLFIWDLVRPIPRWPGIRVALGCVLVLTVQKDAAYLHFIGSTSEKIIPLLRFALLLAVMAAVFWRSSSAAENSTTPRPPSDRRSRRRLLSS